MYVIKKGRWCYHPTESDVKFERKLFEDYYRKQTEKFRQIMRQLDCEIAMAYLNQEYSFRILKELKYELITW